MTDRIVHWKPLEPPAIDLTNCGDACPYCCNMITSYIMHVSHDGLLQLLADVFINNPGGELSPILLVKILTEFKYVGRVVYGRPRSNKAPPGKFIMMTILQLISSELILITFDDNTNECRRSLVIVAATPAYLNNVYWEIRILVESDNVVIT